jgi:hypothetical protein
VTVYRPAESYVHGINGPCAVVPGRVAAWLERHADLRRIRSEARGADPEVDAVLVALATAAAAWRASVDGSEPRKLTEAVAQWPKWMNTSQVADRLGVSASRIRQECRTGRLDAEDQGRPLGWRISREAFEHYKETRVA